MSTYLRRRGRLTRGQARALARWAGEVVIGGDAPGPMDWATRFGRQAPLGLEIGFGMGQALLDWAEESPAWNLLGIEVYQPGIGALLKGRADHGIEHLLVIEGDAQQALETLFEPESLAEARIFFPDPWPKKRHHKRRLITPPFAGLLSERLAPGACLRLATDSGDYAQWMLDVLNAEPALVNASGEASGEEFAERFQGRAITRFEARGRRLGHGVWDLCFRKAAAGLEPAGPQR